MENQILTAITALVPVAGAGLVAFFIKVIEPLIAEGVALYNNKKEEVATKVGVDKYNANLEKAKNVYSIINEQYRITPTLTKTIAAKQAMFDVELKKIVPSLTDDELGHFRQVIAAGLNAGKDAILAPVVEKKVEEKPVINTVVVKAVTKYVDENGNEIKIPATTEAAPVGVTSVVLPEGATPNTVVDNIAASQATPQ